MQMVPTTTNFASAQFSYQKDGKNLTSLKEMNDVLDIVKAKGDRLVEDSTPEEIERMILAFVIPNVLRNIEDPAYVFPYSVSEKLPLVHTMTMIQDQLPDMLRLIIYRDVEANLTASMSLCGGNIQHTVSQWMTANPEMTREQLRVKLGAKLRSHVMTNMFGRYDQAVRADVVFYLDEMFYHSFEEIEKETEEDRDRRNSRRRWGVELHWWELMVDKYTERLRICTDLVKDNCLEMMEEVFSEGKVSSNELTWMYFKLSEMEARFTEMVECQTKNGEPFKELLPHSMHFLKKALEKIAEMKADLYTNL